MQRCRRSLILDYFFMIVAQQYIDHFRKFQPLAWIFSIYFKTAIWRFLGFLQIGVGKSICIYSFYSLWLSKSHIFVTLHLFFPVLHSSFTPFLLSFLPLFIFLISLFHRDFISCLFVLCSFSLFIPLVFFIPSFIFFLNTSIPISFYFFLDFFLSNVFYFPVFLFYFLEI